MSAKNGVNHYLCFCFFFAEKLRKKKAAISQLKTGIMGWVEMFNKTNETKKYICIFKNPQSSVPKWKSRFVCMCQKKYFLLQYTFLVVKFITAYHEAV